MVKALMVSGQWVPSELEKKMQKTFAYNN